MELEEELKVVSNNVKSLEVAEEKVRQKRNASRLLTVMINFSVSGQARRIRSQYQRTHDSITRGLNTFD